VPEYRPLQKEGMRPMRMRPIKINVIAVETGYGGEASMRSMSVSPATLVLADIPMVGSHVARLLVKHSCV